MDKQKRSQELELRLEQELFELEADLARGYTAHYLAVLDFYRRFWHYSFGNSLLIRQQYPHATRVAGLRKWNELGYKVRKGEQAIWIRGPWLRNELNQETGEIEKVLQGYIALPVFDVSQLEGNPTLPHLTFELPGDFDEAYLTAKVNVICADIMVAEHLLPPGVHGLSWGGHITIASHLSTSEKLAALYHELAHEVSDHHIRRGEIPLIQRELEAESAAWLIARFQGMELPWSRDYLTLYRAKVDDLHNSFRRIAEIVKKSLDILKFEEAPAPVLALTGD